MPNERVKVFIAENHDSVRELLRICMEGSGFCVAAEAATLEKATEIIPSLTDLGISLAVVDADLKGYSGKTASVISLLREYGKQIKVIGYSTTIPDETVRKQYDGFVQKFPGFFREVEKLAHSIQNPREKSP